MRVCVIADVMPFRIHAAQQVARPFGEPAYNEERRRYSLGFQDIQDARRIARVWSIIEGKRDGFSARAADTSHHVSGRIAVKRFAEPTRIPPHTPPSRASGLGDAYRFAPTELQNVLNGRQSGERIRGEFVARPTPVLEYSPEARVFRSQPPERNAGESPPMHLDYGVEGCHRVQKPDFVLNPCFAISEGGIH